MKLEVLILSTIITFIIFMVLQPEEGCIPEIGFNLLIPTKKDNEYYHIHHWMYFSVILIVMFICNRGKEIDNCKTIIFGFLLGGIFAGLTFKDRFSIIEKN